MYKKDGYHITIGPPAPLSPGFRSTVESLTYRDKIRIEFAQEIAERLRSDARQVSFASGRDAFNAAADIVEGLAKETK